MNDLLLHPNTREQLKNFLAAPTHALMLVGPTGSGKQTLALALAERLLQLSPETFAVHPYTMLITSEDGKSIGIEAVRQLEKFLALKVPGSLAHDRVIIIKDGHLLSIEAQNALLKMLEEPPQGTIFIITVSHSQAVLPTIRSRAQTIPVSQVEKPAVVDHFGKQGIDAKLIVQAYAISGGLPGLMHALLHNEEHPLLLATDTARQLLSQSSYERLLLVDQLAKQKGLALDIAFILQQMAHVSLQSATGKTADKWETVLQSAYETAEALHGSAQPKLALTKLMLTL